MKTVFDDALFETAAEPDTLAAALATHRRNVAVLRDDVATHGTMVDRTRLGRELHRLGQATSLAGLHDEALACLSEAIAHFDGLERPQVVWWVRARRAWATERAGDAAGAESALTQLLDEATELHLKAYGEAVYRWRARARRVQGDVAGARADLTAALGWVTARPRPVGVDALRAAIAALDATREA